MNKWYEGLNEGYEGTNSVYNADMDDYILGIDAEILKNLSDSEKYGIETNLFPEIDKNILKNLSDQEKKLTIKIHCLWIQTMRNFYNTTLNGDDDERKKVIEARAHEIRNQISSLESLETLPLLIKKITIEALKYSSSISEILGNMLEEKQALEEIKKLWKIDYFESLFEEQGVYPSVALEYFETHKNI